MPAFSRQTRGCRSRRNMRAWRSIRRKEVGSVLEHYRETLAFRKAHARADRRRHDLPRHQPGSSGLHARKGRRKAAVRLQPHARAAGDFRVRSVFGRFDLPGFSPRVAGAYSPSTVSMYSAGDCDARALDECRHARSMGGDEAATVPDTPASAHLGEMEACLANPERQAAFLCEDDAGVVAGFAEASLRRDYVNGCETSPVAFLEGIFVVPSRRRRGVARRAGHRGRALGDEPLLSRTGIRHGRQQSRQPVAACLARFRGDRAGRVISARS